MTIVVAKNYQHFRVWCANQDPPVNPRAKEIYPITTYEHVMNLLGQGKRPDDKLVIYSTPIDWYRKPYSEVLARCGWRSIDRS